MTMFLDADEMADLTGYKQASKQIGQLKLQKIPFHINAAGHPKVARAILEKNTVAKERLPSELELWVDFELKKRAKAQEKDRLKAAKKAQTAQNLPALKRHHTAKRRAAFDQQLPMWADLDAIRAVYQQARNLTQTTGTQHHVDHIIPLNGKLVCGLHVHNNLQVITATENVRKHNRYEVE